MGQRESGIDWKVKCYYNSFLFDICLFNSLLTNTGNPFHTHTRTHAHTHTRTHTHTHTHTLASGEGRRTRIQQRTSRGHPGKVPCVCVCRGECSLFGPLYAVPRLQCP